MFNIRKTISYTDLATFNNASESVADTLSCKTPGTWDNRENMDSMQSHIESVGTFSDERTDNTVSGILKETRENTDSANSHEIMDSHHENADA